MPCFGRALGYGVIVATLIGAALGCAAAAEGRAGVAKPPSPASSAQTLTWADLSNAEGRASHDVALLLRAADGTALELVSLKARGVIVGPLAFTELEMLFRNPAERQLEGTFRIVLPPSAALSRFAMRIGGRLMEGEVVERKAAREVYERFFHRRVDPALLEHQAGNAFSARVFPIEPREDKLIVASYSEELVGSAATYRIALQGLPKLEELSIEVHAFETPSAPGVVAHRVHRFERRQFAPDRDFVLSRAAANQPIAAASRGTLVRAGRFAIAEVTPRLDATPEPVRSLTVLIDTSASRALGLGRDAELVERVFGGLRAANGDPDVRVFGFDQELAEIYRGKASGFGREAIRKLVARGAFGATDLLATLGALRSRGELGRRMLVVTDGVVTAGNAGDALVRELQSSKDRRIERVDVLATGGIRDTAQLAQLARAGSSQGVVLDRDWGPARIARSLGLRVPRPVRVEVPGARFSFPAELAGLLPGDAALVYAEMRDDGAFRVRLDGRESAFEVRSAPEPLVARAVARVEIGELWQKVQTTKLAAAEIEQSRARIVRLSTQQRVLSPLTSFLVLETEDDYARFKLDRRALTGILAVGSDGIEVVKRDESWWKRTVAAREAAGRAARSGSDLDGRAGSTESSPERSSPVRPADGRVEAMPDACPDGTDAMAGCPKRRVIVEESNVTLLQPIPFAAKAAKMYRESLPILDEVVEVMKSNPELLMAAVGHTDSREDPRASVKLSQERAREVRDYLVAHGVAAERVRATGCGSIRPLRSDDSAEDRARNRRVDFKIMDDGFTGIPCGPAIPASPPRRLELLADRTQPAARAGPPSSASPVYVPPDAKAPPHDRAYAEVVAQLASGKADAALELARKLHAEDPANVAALFALGSSYEALSRPSDAARAYGSIVDLYPSHAPYRRFAAALLERLAAGSRGSEAARFRGLALDSYRRAQLERPDHPSSHRLLAFALVRAGRHREAFETLSRAYYRDYGRSFRGVGPALREDLAIVAAAWRAAAPDQVHSIQAELDQLQLDFKSSPSVRIVLSWETDASDVDLHLEPIVPGKGAASAALRRSLPGDTLADVSNGFGPDVFVIERAALPRAFRLGVHLSRAGPMGHAFGVVEIMTDDGKGGLGFDLRPFVLMAQEGYAELGTVGAGKTR
jgi:outer membrane protein OmpA-like peptidoglycan-associated protein